MSELAAAVGNAVGEQVVVQRRLAGGDLNEAFRLELAGGGTVFVKTRGDAPAGSYVAEAQGLDWLRAAGALQVPEVVALSDERPRFLALEWIEGGRLGPAGEEELGRGLAAVHAAGAERFGAAGKLFIGPLVFEDADAKDWPAFYAWSRVMPLARRASLPGGALAAVERVCERLPDLAGPAEPPARLHGDLWSGNVMAGRDGRPWLIDPAAYGGHREIDLAMLRLFGGPGRATFDAYAEVFPPADGHEERIELWQLFPLLVHAVLFGGSYGAGVARIARRYGGC